MEFIGRKEELNILNDAYLSDKYEGIVVYGRRRIGKSEIIKQSFKNNNIKAIYYECSKATEELNVELMCEAVSKELGIPKPAFKHINEFLSYLFEYASNDKLIFVIDEYPYLRGKDSYLDSVIQTVIDKYRMSSKLKLIICGSYVDVMSELIQENSPLYGRFTYKINVKQMNYLESAEFYPTFSNEDKVKLYSVFGGVPYYNQYIDKNLSVKENIINLIASPNARLLSEAESFLSHEIVKLNNANEVFNAIALGNKKFSDILAKSHVSSSPRLASVLTSLINMDIIEKYYPINDESEKKSLYEITERLSKFYYKYIFRNKSMFYTMPSDTFFDEFIEDDYNTQYVPKEFESITKQYLLIENKNHRINPVLYKIGKYYYDDPKNKINGEFDVVTYSKDGYDFYEVKFRDGKLSDAVVNEEKYQLDKLKIKYNKLGFVSKSGFDIKNSSDYILIDLRDIYKKT